MARALMANCPVSDRTPMRPPRNWPVQLRPASYEIHTRNWRPIRSLARGQQAKSRELRAAMRLSRWWRQQGQQAAAYQVLAEVYQWFREGFDTLDLQEARALLEDLSRTDQSPERAR
jgi:predicted ATPase